MGHRRLPPWAWLPRAHGHARPRQHHTSRVTTQDSLGRSVVFCAAHLPTIEAFCRPDAGFGAKDAEFRDRRTSVVCPIATLRGLLL